MRNVFKRDFYSAEVAAPANSEWFSVEHLTLASVFASWTVIDPDPIDFVDADVDVDDNTITEAGHGYKTGLKGQLTTDGVLPTGLSAATDYFVIGVDVDTYKLATSLVNAQAGTAINITAAAGGGTHTFTPTALADGTIKIECSDDPDHDDVTDVASSSQSVTTTATFRWLATDMPYKFFRIATSLSAGQVRYAVNINAKGS